MRVSVVLRTFPTLNRTLRRTLNRHPYSVTLNRSLLTRSLSVVNDLLAAIGITDGRERATIAGDDLEGGSADLRFHYFS